MATVVNTLYPPVISTFSKAFINTTDAVIYFSISSYNSSTDIKHVHVSVVNQLNNEDVLTNPSGILFSDLNYDTASGMYYVTIPVTLLEGNVWNINQFYKVQLRFDSLDWTTLPADERPDTEAKINDYLLEKQSYFSEWSSVCLIRPILQPTIYIKVFENYTGNGVQSFNKGIIPIVGGVYFGDNDTSETETMQSYQIKILSKNGRETLKTYSTIYTGDELNPNNINYRVDLQTLDTSDETEFQIQITATTKNQYTLTKNYSFQIADFLDEEGFSPKLTVELDNENGIAKLHIENTNTVFGNLYIKRLSSQDNFSSAETFHEVHIAGPIDLDLEDNTVNSLVWYRYSAQLENSAGALTQVYYSQVFLPKFYNAVLSRGNKQFSILYNYSISSMKPVVNRAKIDTLGGQYPKFAENAILNYKQFSIKGLISAEGDPYQEFLRKNSVYSGNMRGYYNAYKTNENIRDMVRNDFANYEKIGNNQYPSTSMPTDSTSSYYMSTTQNDWMWEREFREELIKWLNDGEPKLYRSMPEGALVVMLTDISLTPTSGMDRFIWDFSATMYEIADATSLDTLDSLGIYPITKLNTTTGSGGVGPDPEPEYVEVVSVGQLYQYEVTSKEDIRNLLLQNLQIKYGKASLDQDIWDDKNVLSNKKPDDLYLKNVKIYFHNSPNLYYVDSQGNIQWVNENSYNPKQHQEQKINLGYSFDVATSASEGNITVFVNDRGYYQLPNDLDVQSLSFNRVGDIVTVEYTLVYKEQNNLSSVISGNTVDRTLIGQHEGVFEPNHYLGEEIRSKYNYTNGEITQRMQYWKGICVDVTPFAMCYIQYRGEHSDNTYVVGETGVLHMLKDVEVSDICFVGRRMKLQPKNRQPYLKEWEYVLDDSVEDASGTSLNWFTVIKEETNKPVEIHSNESLFTEISPNWQATENTTSRVAVLEQGYNSTEDIKKPKRNTVYNIAGDLKIYYHDHWYNFKNIAKDSTNLIGNTATEEIGLAIVPIEGQINYYGNVIRSSYA